MPMARDELELFLAEPRLAHLATVGSDGGARVRPIWFVWDDGAFWFTTRLAVRRTGADIVAGSRVAISVASEERPYRAVLARGAAEVWDRAVRRWLERISFRYGEREGRFWLRGALREADRAVLRLVPDQLITWDYGKGDYRRLNAGESLITKL